MSEDHRRIETKLIHAGEPVPRIEGAVSLPIFQSSMYEYGGESDPGELRYIRLSNTPNHDALHRKLAALENAEDALVTASGMAAISTTLLTVLEAGDHLLVQESLYGGTYGFITQDLPRFGITIDFIGGDDPEEWRRKRRSETRAIYVETLTNPLLKVADLAAVVAFARENGLVSIIDNTFATPVNYRPPEMGFDLSLHSGTKYLNGHSDVVAGAVIGRAGLVEQVHGRLKRLGGTLDPHACFLLHRGLKTLAVRVARQNESATRIARFLDGHPRIEVVHYPGLEGHAGHQRALQWFDGFSGMLSFEPIGGSAAAERIIRKLSLPVKAPSLGGVETLITRPATTSHRGVEPEARRRMGVTDSLIRLSVGLEAAEDIIDDLDRALGL